MEPLYYYTAREYCKPNNCPERLAEFVKKLREETVDMPYDEAKQRIWELFHDCDSVPNYETPKIRVPIAVGSLAHDAMRMCETAS